MSEVITLNKHQGSDPAWAYDLNEVAQRLEDAGRQEPRSEADMFALRALRSLYRTDSVTNERELLMNFHALSVVFSEAMRTRCDRDQA